MIERLIAAHRLLNREIQRELARRVPDSFRLMHLKKRRLAVKDQLYRHHPGGMALKNAARQVLTRLGGSKPALGRTES
ncbi:YdcH family protein [Flavisphingomonas formosensis]|uniref:YdcH family protein n=1 Tax=Flavisphingomonas formosensis TaxID=861534 RepID=UPI001E35BFFB|nr:YdcH family protein [Sphingomonas formosensis]